MKKNVMVNETTYLRECKGFTKVSSNIIHNDKLNVIDIGMMAMLLSSGDGYVINKETVQRLSGLGETTFNNSWKRLEKERYISSRKEHTPQGYKYIYVISNLPMAGVEQPLKTNLLDSTIENQHLEIKPLDPSPGKAVLNIDIINTEENNVDIINTEEINLEITNKGELVEKIEVKTSFNEYDSVQLPNNNTIEEYFDNPIELDISSMRICADMSENERIEIIDNVFKFETLFNNLDSKINSIDLDTKNELLLQLYNKYFNVLNPSKIKKEIFSDYHYYKQFKKEGRSPKEIFYKLIISSQFLYPDSALENMVLI